MNKLLLINAVIWAIEILLAAYLVKESKNYKYLFGVLIVAAGLSNALIHQFLKKDKSAG